MVSEANALYGEIMSENTETKNHLHSNWRRMPLLHIDLSYNHFSSVPLETLGRLTSLQTLNLSFNCLQNISWDIRPDDVSGPRRQLFFSSLKYLSLQGNGLAHVAPRFLAALSRVETLNLQDNAVRPCACADPSAQGADLTCVAIGRLRTLKHLNLKNNGIRTLPPDTFLESSLLSLDLSANAPLAVPRGALRGARRTLRSLVLSGGNMSGSELWLPCMPALARLDVSNNRLQELPGSLSCSPLAEIDVRNNQLLAVNRSLLLALAPRLRLMHISGNGFNCCDSSWLRAALELHVELPDVNDTVCFTSEADMAMAEYLREPSGKCLLHTHAQDVPVGTKVITVLFVAVMSTALLGLCRKVCRTQSAAATWVALS
ncbi:Leucine-rich repeat-containing protein 32 [Liparis tanakae]|uniref:Leucine-rich repeat-containing protein 32 n=1 Tax=Liparis tanakae TaxID=230148 RepID=A0A4Z2G3U1_9TELE|nr:Leucine-rich repeat-containing protein 32 [Liparis tanakae]